MPRVIVALFVAICCTLLLLAPIQASVTYNYNVSGHDLSVSVDSRVFYSDDTTRIKYSQNANGIRGDNVRYTQTGFIDDANIETESSLSFQTSPQVPISGVWLADNIGASNRDNVSCRLASSGFYVSGKDQTLTLGAESDGYTLTHGIDARGRGTIKAGYNEQSQNSTARDRVHIKAGHYNFTGLFVWETGYPADPEDGDWLIKPVKCPFGSEGKIPWVF